MFACHRAKKILYETALRDGSFLTQAASELTEIMESENQWCQWIENAPGRAHAKQLYRRSRDNALHVEMRHTPASIRDAISAC